MQRRLLLVTGDEAFVARKTGEGVLGRPGLLISKVCVGVGAAQPHCFCKIIQEEAFWRRVYR